MRKIILVSAIATLAFAQGKPAAPPSRTLSPASSSADAGVTTTRTMVGADGGVTMMLPPTPGAALEIEKLRKEITELKLRALEAEQRQQAKADALTAQMDKMSKQLDSIKDQLSDVSEAEQKRVQAEEAVATRRSATASASSNLNAVLSTLASGNTSGVDPSLRYAEGVFTGNAQKNVQLARAALAQGDVFAARELLILALIDAERQQ